MEIVIQLGSIFLLSWVISRFEPIHMLTEALPDKILYNVIRLLLSCLKCISFWLTLTYTGNIFIASGMAFISFWYDKIIGRIENKVRL